MPGGVCTTDESTSGKSFYCIGQSSGGDVELDNLYQGSVGVTRDSDGNPAAYGPLIFLAGDVDNLGGAINILNNSGSFAQTGQSARPDGERDGAQRRRRRLAAQRLAVDGGLDEPLLGLRQRALAGRRKLLAGRQPRRGLHARPQDGGQLGHQPRRHGPARRQRQHLDGLRPAPWLTGADRRHDGLARRLVGPSSATTSRRSGSVPAPRTARSAASTARAAWPRR